MLREEAIKILENERGYMINHAGNAQVEAFTMAIKALEQEHCEDVKEEIWKDIPEFEGIYECYVE